MNQDYAAFASTLSPGVHASILAVAQQLGEDTPHEDVPNAPLYDPAVEAAVAAMLGPNWEPDECRHIHANPAPAAGGWHVDDYCGQPWPDGLRFAILCYFPQDTPPELGPTAIRIDGREILGGGPAGSCLLMAQTVEHRATGNVAGRPRVMLKYLFRAPVADRALLGDCGGLLGLPVESLSHVVRPDVSHSYGCALPSRGGCCDCEDTE